MSEFEKYLSSLQGCLLKSFTHSFDDNALTIELECIDDCLRASTTITFMDLISIMCSAALYRKDLSEIDPIAAPNSVYDLCDIFYLPNMPNLNIDEFFYKNFNIMIEMDFFYICVGAKKLNIDGHIYQLSF